MRYPISTTYHTRTHAYTRHAMVSIVPSRSQGKYWMLDDRPVVILRSEGIREDGESKRIWSIKVDTSGSTTPPSGATLWYNTECLFTWNQPSKRGATYAIYSTRNMSLVRAVSKLKHVHPVYVPLRLRVRTCAWVIHTLPFYRVSNSYGYHHAQCKKRKRVVDPPDEKMLMPKGPLLTQASQLLREPLPPPPPQQQRCVSSPKRPCHLSDIHVSAIEPDPFRLIVERPEMWITLPSSTNWLPSI